MVSTSTACLPDESIFAFVQGRLPVESVPELEEHLSICTDCRAVLAETARFFAGGGATVEMGPRDVAEAETWESLESPTRLPAGTHVSRYVLSGVIGAGAAGVVYRAYDPELRREVALKLLRAVPARDSASLKARLLREAQAMARLSHPNVVSVYDVGSYGSQIFIVLELVKGQNLAEWLDERPRSWQEICWAFGEAGKGLAAAHAVRLVHRDFKPANVLLGTDGRVRVTDFGLARSTELASSPPLSDADRETVVINTTHSNTSFSITTTQAGLAGTPVYMAPEQFARQSTDERTDQFGFCVALYLALYKRHPFLDFDGPSRRYSLAELGAQVSRGLLRTAPTSEVPMAIWGTLRRGLQVAPEERFPSMDELLARLVVVPQGLERQAGRPLRRVLTLGASLLVAGTVALVLERRTLSEPAAPKAAPRLEALNPGEHRNTLSTISAMAAVPPTLSLPVAAAPMPSPSSTASARGGSQPKAARVPVQRPSRTRQLVAPTGRKQYSDGLKEPF